MNVGIVLETNKYKCVECGNCLRNKQIQVCWMWELFKKQINTGVVNVGIVLETNKYKCVECGNCFRNKRIQVYWMWELF